MSSETIKIHTLLLVEDDARLAQLVSAYLEQQGYAVVIDDEGGQVEALIEEYQPSLVILDLMLPKASGLDICRELRAKSDLPIIMLTAKSSDIDHVVGLEIGADDYIIKPVEPVVLLARIKSQLRRYEISHSQSASNSVVSEQYQIGSLFLNAQSQVVKYQGKKITLTSQEYELLLILVKNAGKVLSRDDIFHQLRGFDYDGLDRTVDVKISRLRKKFNDNPIDPEKIKTVWGKGYLFVKDAWND